MASRKSSRRDSASSPSEFVAGNGLIHRRALLTHGFALAGAASVGTGVSAARADLKEDEWSMHQGANVMPYGTRTRFEKNTLRILSNPNGEPRTQHARVPHQLLNGTITPNPLHFTILHNGIPDIDPDQHKLVIHGMVRQPLEFTLDKLMRYPMVTRTTFVECGGNSAPMFSDVPVQATLQHLHGLCSNAEWTGVLLSTLLDEVGVDPKAKWLISEGSDTALISRSTPLKKAWDDALIAMYQNGERIMPDQGFPLRLILPGWEGNMQTKFVRRIMITDQPAMTYYEERNYSPLLPDGKAYRFYFVNEVKSFITHPSFGATLKEPGYYEISGLAYSGAGHIERVMVSADGGESWADAIVQKPANPKSFTRFHAPWRWDGSPAILTSRAIDSGGNIQPLRSEFVAKRGETLKPVTNTFSFSNQHYNSLTCWGIAPTGEIKHVYV